MKIYWSIFVFLISASTIFSQYVSVQNISCNIKSVDQTALVEKMETLANTSNAKNVYLDVVFDKTETMKMNGVISSIVAKADLTIIVYSLISNEKIDSKNFIVSSTGSNEYSATKNLINRISNKRSQIKSFLNDIMKNIAKPDCTDIVNAINRESDMRRYPTALQICIGNQGCGEQITLLKNDIYKKYQTAYCAQHLTKAKALYSIKDYEGAIREIINISPDSSCFEETNKLLNEIKTTYDGDYKDELSLYESYLNNREDKRFNQLLELMLLNGLRH